MTIYLTEKDLVMINVIQLETYSNQEQIGIKEPSALNMCVQQPKQEVFGKVLYQTIEDKGAILFELLINKHCFFNGNKRTAVMALYTFLTLNNVELVALEDDLVEFTVAIAERRGEQKITHDEIVRWIKNNSNVI